MQSPTANKKELETNIENCLSLIKENLINGIQAHDSKNRQLIRELVDLRRQLHELKEGIVSEASNSSICGHRFLLQTRRDSISASNRYCDKCGQVIWAMVQGWFKCRMCSYYCHAKCISVVTRLCASVKANDDPVYELTICPEKGLSNQKYRCAECRTRLNIDPDKPEFTSGRTCDYNGLYFCSVCHWSDTAVIPARVVRNWDFEPREVSRPSKQFLKIMQKKPVLLLEALNPQLFSYIKELRTVKALRQELLLIKPFLLSCRTASKMRMLALLRPYTHFLDSLDAYCIQDLIDLNSNVLEDRLKQIISTYEKHIRLECESCRGKGFVCEMCKDKDVLFPFDEFVTACRKCKALFHRLCFDKMEVCPRCERRSHRSSLTNDSNINLPGL